MRQRRERVATPVGDLPAVGHDRDAGDPGKIWRELVSHLLERERIGGRPGSRIQGPVAREETEVVHEYFSPDGIARAPVGPFDRDGKRVDLTGDAHRKLEHFADAALVPGAEPEVTIHVRILKWIVWQLLFIEREPRQHGVADPDHEPVAGVGRQHSDREGEGSGGRRHVEPVVGP